MIHQDYFICPKVATDLTRDGITGNGDGKTQKLYPNSIEEGLNGHWVFPSTSPRSIDSFAPSQYFTLWQAPDRDKLELPTVRCSWE